MNTFIEKVRLSELASSSGQVQGLNPKILVVTDGLNFSAGSKWGLSEFVGMLAEAEIFGMLPTVTCVTWGEAIGAERAFHFDDKVIGLNRSRFDVVLLFGQKEEAQQSLPRTEIDAITSFMDEGGGVFAAGDHGTLGAFLCSDIPRVRSMRKWKQTDNPPDAASVRRLSTLARSNAEVETIDHEADGSPQRLYLSYRPNSSRRQDPTRIGFGLPHPLMQLGQGRYLEFFPDHPHEGECCIPSCSDLAQIGEWRKFVDESGNDIQLLPEAVAWSVSHGSGYVGTGQKHPLHPRLFIAVAAYDGHLVNCGRIVTDSTWHHYVNLNLVGTESPSETIAFLAREAQEMRVLEDLCLYYRGMVKWLMPEPVVLAGLISCLSREMKRHPILEDLPRKSDTEIDFDEIGTRVLSSLSRRLPAWELRALEKAALSSAMISAQKFAGFSLKASDLESHGPYALAALASSVARAVQSDDRDVSTIAAWEKYGGHANHVVLQRLMQAE